MSQDSAANDSSSGSGSGQSNGGPPAGSIPDALLERMMDRKLRMLDMEYEECLKATKGYNIEDYDQGPVGDEEAEAVPPAAAATAGGYAPFGSGDAPARSSMPLEGGGASANDDEEWSEAWAEYKRECAEEAAEAAEAGITDADVANQTVPDPEPQKPAPLSDSTIAQIRGVMSGIKLKPPIWALGVPEEVWTAQILSRMGMGARPQVAPVPAGATAPATSAAADASAQQAAAVQKALERKRKKKQKAKRAAKAAAAAAAAAADFPVEFPAIDGAAVSAVQATTAPAAAEESVALQTPD